MTTDMCRLLHVRNELPELVIVGIAYGAYLRQICSPSIWWDNKILFQLERSFSENLSELPIHLFLSVGSLEEQDDMILPWQELIRAIESRKYSGLRMKTVMIEGETHLSAQAAAIVKGLKFVFSTYK